MENRFYAFSVYPADQDEVSEIGGQIIFALNEQQAKSASDLSGYFDLDELVTSKIDKLKPVNDGPREAKDSEYLEAGWHEMDEATCDSCGRGGFGLQVCPVCNQCSDCGCDEYLHTYQ